MHTTYSYPKGINPFFISNFSLGLQAKCYVVEVGSEFAHVCFLENQNQCDRITFLYNEDTSAKLTFNFGHRTFRRQVRR